MATKPATLPRIWCSAGVYTTGPFIGDISRVDPGAGIAAEGYRPGANFPTAAEHANFEEFHITNWVATWLALGSSTGAANAHIVETAATGRTTLVGADFIDAVNETVVNITGANTLAPAVLVTSLAGGAAIQAAIDPNSFGFVTTVGAGAGSGVSVTLAGTLTAGSGVDVSDDGTGDGTAFRAVLTGDGNGAKLSVDGTGYAAWLVHTGGNSALRVDGSTSATAAVINGNGGTQGLLVDADGSTIAATLIGGNTAGTDVCNALTGNTSGKAYVATLLNTADLSSRGFYCSTSTSSAAVPAEFRANGTGGNGAYALIIAGDASTPTLGTISMGIQDARPTTAPSGMVTMTNLLGLSVGTSDNQSRSVWHSLNGYACAFLTSYTGVGYTISLAGLTTVATITTAAVGDEVKAAGATVLLRMSFSVQNSSVTAYTVMGIQVRDVTAGNVPILSRTGTGAGVTSGYSLQPSNLANNFYWVPGPTIEFSVVVPAVGTRTYDVRMSAPTTDPFRIRDLTFVMAGTVA